MEVASPFHETEQFFYEKIPLTRAMGVRVEAFDRQKLILTAPLEENHNHLGTAFGGSLGALATLAGYGLLWLELGDRECHIVIRSSSISYERPVHGILRAVCCHPAEAELAGFKDTFLKKGKARIRLHVTIEENDQVCVIFEGMFVAIR
ncbi:MAG: YiiD C-terminal domain-containing protein [Luteolibacter sp.]